MTVNVLGVEYTLKYLTREQDPALESCDGYCDASEKTIVIRDYSEEEKKDPMTLKNLKGYQQKVGRHETIHAFLHESGLACNSNSTECWATNEEMVDWLAIQGPKILTVWEEARLL